MLHFWMIFSCFFLHVLHVFPKSRKSLSVLSERENLTPVSSKMAEDGKGDVYDQNSKSNLEYM